MPKPQNQKKIKKNKKNTCIFDLVDVYFKSTQKVNTSRDRAVGSSSGS